MVDRTAGAIAGGLSAGGADAWPSQPDPLHYQAVVFDRVRGMLRRRAGVVAGMVGQQPGGAVCSGGNHPVGAIRRAGGGAQTLRRSPVVARMPHRPDCPTEILEPGATKLPVEHDRSRRAEADARRLWVDEFILGRVPERDRGHREASRLSQHRLSGRGRDVEVSGRARSHDGSVEGANMVEAVVQLTPARSTAPHYPGATVSRGDSGREVERAGWRRQDRDRLAPRLSRRRMADKNLIGRAVPSGPGAPQPAVGIGGQRRRPGRLLNGRERRWFGPATRVFRGCAGRPAGSHDARTGRGAAPGFRPLLPDCPEPPVPVYRRLGGEEGAGHHMHNLRPAAAYRRH